VTETRGLPTPDYTNLLSCRVLWDGGERLVSGSLLGREQPRVVQIDGFHLDAQPEGIILMMESMDVPGVVGQVASLLGTHNINIAEWRMGRATPSDQTMPSINLSFVNLDSPASPEILEQVMQLDKVFNVRQVTL
jgi:D-3-phosphoglycerate dehydrogenase